MVKPRDERPEYVVELDVAGVAIVAVRAESPSDASGQAEERCRPADVMELHTVSASLVVRVGDRRRGSAEAGSSSSPESRPKGRGRGGKT